VRCRPPGAHVSLASPMTLRLIVANAGQLHTKCAAISTFSVLLHVNYNEFQLLIIGGGVSEAGVNVWLPHEVSGFFDLLIRSMPFMSLPMILSLIIGNAGQLHTRCAAISTSSVHCLQISSYEFQMIFELLSLRSKS